MHHYIKLKFRGNSHRRAHMSANMWKNVQSIGILSAILWISRKNCVTCRHDYMLSYSLWFVAIGIAFMSVCGLVGDFGIEYDYVVRPCSQLSKVTLTKVVSAVHNSITIIGFGFSALFLLHQKYVKLRALMHIAFIRSFIHSYRERSRTMVTSFSIWINGTQRSTSKATHVTHQW